MPAFQAIEVEDFVLNRPAYRDGASPILVAGDNFGCGSSREHAPWSLAGLVERRAVPAAARSTDVLSRERQRACVRVRVCSWSGGGGNLGCAALRSDAPQCTLPSLP